MVRGWIINNEDPNTPLRDNISSLNSLSIPTNSYFQLAKPSLKINVRIFIITKKPDHFLEDNSFHNIRIIPNPFQCGPLVSPSPRHSTTYPLPSRPILYSAALLFLASAFHLSTLQHYTRNQLCSPLCIGFITDRHHCHSVAHGIPTPLLLHRHPFFSSLNFTSRSLGRTGVEYYYARIKLCS